MRFAGGVGEGLESVADASGSGSKSARDPRIEVERDMERAGGRKASSAPNRGAGLLRDEPGGLPWWTVGPDGPDKESCNPTASNLIIAAIAIIAGVSGWAVPGYISSITRLEITTNRDSIKGLVQRLAETILNGMLLAKMAAKP